ncbi:NADPH-dependent F420 reductase [Tenacibaculum aiptasiae]|uniref:NADPH-dependent F420 reductase n=1 Tax=Tenacibaculum aiptasiae TaxID=426481 RepID=UPI003B5CD918
MKINFIGAGNVASSLGDLFTNVGYEVKYATPNPKENQIAISEACESGDIVCFAIPYNAMNNVLLANKEALKGKIVIDITNAIHIENWTPLFLGEDSGGEQTARLLSESKVVKAFNTIFADVMKTGKQEISGNKLTVFIASDDEDAAEVVKKLANTIGFEGLVVGGIQNARHLEAMAHLNISIALNGGGTDAGFTYFQRK